MRSPLSPGLLLLTIFSVPLTDAHAKSGTRPARGPLTEQPSASVRGLTWRRTKILVEPTGSKIQRYGFLGRSVTRKTNGKAKEITGEENGTPYDLEFDADGVLTASHRILVTGTLGFDPALRRALQKSPLILRAEMQRIGKRASIMLDGDPALMWRGLLLRALPHPDGWDVIVSRRIQPETTFDTSSRFWQVHTITNSTRRPVAATATVW